jgi:hypothetical protein
MTCPFPVVMAALVAAIHVFRASHKDVDGRDSAFGRPGHDDHEILSSFASPEASPDPNLLLAAAARSAVGQREALAA